MATKEGRLTNVDCVRVATALCPSISDIGFLHDDLLNAQESILQDGARRPRAASCDAKTYLLIDGP